MKIESNQEHNLLEIIIPENAVDIILQLFLPVTLASLDDFFSDLTL